MTAVAGPTRLLGIPLGDFGFLASILLSVATGFFAFFGSCFLAIVSLLVWNTLGHHAIDYADAYLYVAAPVGLAVMAVAFVFFMGTWLRRKFTGAA